MHGHHEQGADCSRALAFCGRFRWRGIGGLRAALKQSLKLPARRANLIRVKAISGLRRQAISYCAEMVYVVGVARDQPKRRAG